MSTGPSDKVGRYRPLAGILFLNALLTVYSTAAADFVRYRSTPVEVTTGLILGWVGLVGALSYIEAALIGNLFTRGGWRGRHEIRDFRKDLGQPWRNLHLPLSFAIVGVLGVNLLLFDQIAGGFFVDEQRANSAIIRMRSNEEAVQRDGIFTASRLHERRVREELVGLLENPGPVRALAAWALGKVGTPAEAPSLVQLLRDGNPRERGAAAVALGRLRYEQLTPEIASRLRGEEEPVESYVVALGFLGDRHATYPLVELMLDEQTAPDHLALAAWAFGGLDDPRACAPLIHLVGPAANPLTCATTFSLYRLRCEGAAPALIEAFEASEVTDRCDVHHFVDLDGRSIRLWPGKLYRVALLEAIGSGPDPGVGPWLQDLSSDLTQVPQVRDLVTDLLSRRRLP